MSDLMTEEERRTLKKMRTFHNGSYAKLLDKLIASAQPEPQWIPCSERLPDKPIRVQAQLDNWWIVTAYYDNAWHTVPDIGQELKNDEVIAWMPLPEPWKGDKDAKNRP